jgi:serine/threonine protein kinase
MSTGVNFFVVTFGLLTAVVVFVLLVGYVFIPLFRGVGTGIAACFTAIGWFFAHIAEFIGGMIGDTIRSVGAILAMLLLAPLAVVNVIIGRWSAAGHFADSVKREFIVCGACVYRVLLRRPLKLFWLHGLLEGIEQRVPEAVYASPGSDKPTGRTGQFDGYTIVGSLAGGGSGGKLYIARPDDDKRNKLVGQPEHVVIKAFALSEGSSLPQIVRESRALECAKQLGHVLDHGMDEHRFHYVMPYHPGDHLGIIARQLHGESDGSLDQRQLSQVMGYLKDLLATLTLYHEGGLWHKDVKPENIIVHDGRAHLVDLGLVTPLKSAMTLTTHGTEYFRDPEMVRQALRGVKVHQVDGAKFDIYAVGAVLYYMIENTFPAHGGLSRFSKKSPEALRWIIRRAMAEYHQRYTSAAMMLADLEAVAASDDPFAYIPARLPSMRSGDVDLDVEVETESPHASQAHAASAVPPKQQSKVWGVGVGVGHGGPFAKAGRLDQPNNPSSPKRKQRPRLRITNWWTGAYQIERDANDAASSTQTPVSPARSPRPKHERASAQDQIRNAQKRARELQNRAAKRRQKVGIERSPSPMLAFLVIGFLIIVGLVMIPIVALTWSTDQTNRQAGPSPVTTTISGMHHGLPVLLVVDEDDLVADAYRHQLDDIVDRYSQRNYHVVQSPTIAKDLLLAYQQWQAGAADDEPTEMEAIMARHDLYGFLLIKQSNADAQPAQLAVTLVRSGDPDAANRRRPIEQDDRLPQSDREVSAALDGRFIIINDHPSKSDVQVSSEIKKILTVYQSRGWELVTASDEVEAAIRGALPAVVSASNPLSERLRTSLESHDYQGVFYIHATTGTAPAHERIGVTILSVDH